MPNQPKPPDEILSELHEFDVLWSTQITQKKKKWHDGKLKFFSFNKRAILYDEQDNFVADYFHNKIVNEGDELVFDRVLVRVISKGNILIRDIVPALIGLRNEAKNKDSSGGTNNNDRSTSVIGTPLQRRASSTFNANKGTRRVESTNNFATSPSINSGIMTTNDTFGNSNTSINNAINLFNVIDENKHNRISSLHSTPQPFVTPLKSGPSLGLKRRRIITPATTPPPPPNIRNITTTRVTVNYADNGITETRHLEPSTRTIRSNLSPVLPETNDITHNETIKPSHLNTPSIKSSNKRNTRGLLSLQNRKQSSTKSLTHSVPSIDNLRFNRECTPETATITPELVYQLSQAIDNITEEVIGQSDSDDGLTDEMNSILTQSKPLKSNISRESSFLAESDSRSAITNSTVPSTVTIEETGPWTKEALELFAWRPPGLN